MTVTIRNHQRLIKIELRKIRRDSLKLLTLFKLDRAELGVLFVNDRRMETLNRIYRATDRTTDVLSFPLYHCRREMPAGEEFLLGDIVINAHAARRQASAYGAGPHEEIRRLLIHGFLHLLGYDHEQSRQEAGKMKRRERTLRVALETVD